MVREQKEAKSGAVGTLPGAVASGRRRVKSKVSAYSPMASRIERQGKAPETIKMLLVARKAVARGSSLTELVVIGSLAGWNLRQVLSSCCGEPVTNWDQRAGRTQLERAAVVERALGEFGQLTLSLGGGR